MRFMPKILAMLFKPAPLPPPDGGARSVDRAAVIRALSDRMIAAEVDTVSAQARRVEAMFADFQNKFEDRHGR